MRESHHLYSRDMELEGRQFPNTIKRHRKINGYSQKRLAKKLGVSVTHISLWENGKLLPGFINVLKLCVIFQVSPFDLYYDLLYAISEDLYASEWKETDTTAMYENI